MWLLTFNVAKCVHLRIQPRGLQECNKLLSNYALLGQAIPTNHEVKYLGILIDESLIFTKHIESTANKANQTLGIVRRHFYACEEPARRQLYTSLVRPKLEYASPVWDPYTASDTHKLEAVQRRAVRFIKKDYRWRAPVTHHRQSLKLDTLQERRNVARLRTFYRYYNGDIVVNNMPTLHLASFNTRQAVNPLVIQNTLPTCTNYMRYSYAYQAISDWNLLPEHVVLSQNIHQFSAQLNEHLGLFG